ncbi:glycerophosphodiester phosphodiesterase [Desulfovibrio psychrotolerans]|uniref:Glycerophosphoryl diester phosphodiesterase n=1 Tax=Desulfovibrio psychrotolerans TaxID=415242 RepID=A0A7J0BVS9_9BACT|nr:glycerophosphodiester phosphodiesterase family protein [Desulfovibrio psychrotolerans]GFM37265.1 glycerophosphoryl diester phosphodiesterase [Desulfovibrio psychrotolerans]
MLPNVPVMNIAHRGARSVCPENTLLAAGIGLAHGAHMWELDVSMTADGELVIVHDDTLERTTDVALRPEFAARAPWRVCDFTLAELRTLDAGSWFLQTDPFGQIAAGGVDAKDRAAFAGLRVPTLREGLEFTRDADWCVNVEIKDHEHLIGHDTIVEATLELIRATDMADRVLLSSFQHRYLMEAGRRMPGMPLGVLVEEPHDMDPVDLVRSLRAHAYHPETGLFTEDDVARLRDAGFGVNVFTINDAAEMARLVAWGVTGLFTDFPLLCRSVLQGETAE